MTKEYRFGAWILLIAYTGLLVSMLWGALRSGGLAPSAMIFPFLLFLPSYALATALQKHAISLSLLLASIIILIIPIAGMVKFGSVNLFVTMVFVATFLFLIGTMYKQYTQRRV